MMRSLRRMAIAVLLALPGVGLAFVTKPLVLGEGILLLGILLAVVAPVGWIVAVRSPPAGGKLDEGTVDKRGRES